MENNNRLDEHLNEIDKSMTSLKVVLAQMQEQIKTLQADLTGIKTNIRWVGITVTGAVLVAVVQWLLNGGLSS